MDFFVQTQTFLPKKLITSLAGVLACLKYRPIKNFLIGSFIRAYEVDMAEADALSIDQYADFNDFFTRRLRSGSRPLPENMKAMVSPADGVISELGQISQMQIIQAKGKMYSVSNLLGDNDLAGYMDGGCFTTVYLSPKDYHRVHMPLNGKPLSIRYIPGKLFSVNNRTAQNVDSLFAINERLVITFEDEETKKNFVLVMVGALIVGGMETVLTGPIKRSKVRKILNFQKTTLLRGEELGRFYLGSTVILMCPRGMVELDEVMVPSMSVKMGQQIGLL